MAEPYAIQYAEDAVADIKALRAYDRQIIVEGIETHLRFEPRKQSRARIKAMLQPFWSQFRLRLEAFRVYYDVVEERRTVYVLRVLSKTTVTTPENSP